EAAADVEVLGYTTKVHRHHQEVRDQLCALGLKMVLGHPEGVVAALIHALGVSHDLVHRLGQLLFRVAAVGDRRASVAEVLHIGGAVIGTVEFRYHGALDWRVLQGVFHARQGMTTSRLDMCST